MDNAKDILGLLKPMVIIMKAMLIRRIMDMAKKSSVMGRFRKAFGPMGY